VRQKLTDAQIAAAAESLRQHGYPVSWRSLQAQLVSQYRAAGRTDRLRSACRILHRGIVRASDQSEAQQTASGQRLQDVLRERDLALARALRAEERETAHQDRWAAEIHSLRESVEQLKGERARRAVLEEQLVRLQRELQGLYRRLARYER
jgi:hypothetical protein